MFATRRMIRQMHDTSRINLVIDNYDIFKHFVGYAEQPYRVGDTVPREAFMSYGHILRWKFHFYTGIIRYRF